MKPKAEVEKGIGTKDRDAEFNHARAEAFAEKMLGVINGGALAVMISLGHRTGLFDTMNVLGPSTSAGIAGASSLNERYVREWLGAMVTGRIVEYEPEESVYSLPAEHAAYLTRAASPNNLAVTAQFLPLLGQVEDLVVECFRHGGGLPYSAYPRFHELMAEESGQTVLSALLDSILPLVPGAMEKLTSGADVLDVGCGSGRALILMAQTFPDSRFTGYDLTEGGITRAIRESEEKGVKNVRFEVKDAASSFEHEEYDLVTAFDAIHDQARPDKVLRFIINALKPDGSFLMQDIAGSSRLENNLDHPTAPFGYTISCMHCMSVSLAQGGAGLGAMWGEELAEQMLGEAGFTGVEKKHLPHDIQNVYFVAAKN